MVKLVISDAIAPIMRHRKISEIIAPRRQELVYTAHGKIWLLMAGAAQ